jgi:hypothetical protein
VPTDPDLRSLGSLGPLRSAFRAAAAPDLPELVGEHLAEFVGPVWLRAPAPLALRVLGLPGWCGKRFDRVDDDGVVPGVNLVRRSGVLADSIPLAARLGASRVDGRPVALVSYPADAPFPWPHVIDELRVLREGTLIALMTVSLLPGAVAAPFLLHRAQTPRGAGSCSGS